MWLKDIWGKIRESCECLNTDKKYILGSGSQICLLMNITWRALKKSQSLCICGGRGYIGNLCAVNLKLLLEEVYLKNKNPYAPVCSWNKI